MGLIDSVLFQHGLLAIVAAMLVSRVSSGMSYREIRMRDGGFHESKRLHDEELKKIKDLESGPGCCYVVTRENFTSL